MKKSIISFLAFAFILCLSLGACKHSHDHGDAAKHDHDEATEEVDKSGAEYTSKYVCPMHCAGSGSAEVGTCPACGMDYVLNEEHESDGHDHDGEDADHDHDGDDHDGHDHG